MKKVIYYFTGTGNSLRAAERIAEHIGDTELISMRNKPEEVSAAECDVIGFVYPVYHWTMPEPVVNFVEKLQVNKNAYIFVIAMPSFVMGYACELLEQMMQEKGAAVAYGAKVNGVANYAIVYPPMPSPKRVVPKTERKLTKIADDIAQMKHCKIPKANTIVRKKYPKMMPKYKALQAYADYPFTISDTCVGCGLCAKVCPCSNIVIQDKKPVFQHHCANCMACVCYCPNRAIGYSISENDLKQLSELPEKVSIVKKMCLPAKRKLYHNPYITAKDLMKNRIVVKTKG